MNITCNNVNNIYEYEHEQRNVSRNPSSHYLGIKCICIDTFPQNNLINYSK